MPFDYDDYCDTMTDAIDAIIGCHRARHNSMHGLVLDEAQDHCNALEFQAALELLADLTDPEPT